MCREEDSVEVNTEQGWAFWAIFRGSILQRSLMQFESGIYSIS